MELQREAIIVDQDGMRYFEYGKDGVPTVMITAARPKFGFAGGSWRGGISSAASDVGEFACSSKVRNTVAGAVAGSVTAYVQSGGINPLALAAGAVVGGGLGLYSTDATASEATAAGGLAGAAEGSIEGASGVRGGLVGGAVGGALSQSGAPNSLTGLIGGATYGAISAPPNSAFRPFNRFVGGVKGGYAGLAGGLAADGTLLVFEYLCGD